MKITGFEELTLKLEEAQKAIADLNGGLGELSCNPEDAASLEGAIQRILDIIDDKLGAFAENLLVASIIEEIKEFYRTGILEREAVARLESSISAT